MNRTKQSDAGPPRPSTHHLLLDDPEALKNLAELFRTAPYTEAEIRRLLGAASPQVIRRVDVPVLARALPAEGLLPTLIRLFMLGLPVPAEVLRPLLTTLSLERLEALGLVRPGPSGVVPLVRLYPVREFFVASDAYLDPASIPSDYVIPPNPTSGRLAFLTARRPVKAACDIGTGCGVLALLAAGHCERVVATDINPRALNFTAFNAALNGIRNIECRLGSLLDPVADDTFDLIVSNPPYVVSPDSDFQYRDSGEPGDTLVRNLVRGLPRHLNEDAYAFVLCEWVIKRDGPWSAPLREWLAGSGCDALLLHSKTFSALEYAAGWNQTLLPTHVRDYEAALDRWMEHYRRCGIEALAGGAIVMRRRKGGTNWIEEDQLPDTFEDTSGEHILRMIEARGWLASREGDADLLNTAFRPAEGLRMVQAVLPVDGRLDVQETRVALIRGIPYQEVISSPLAFIIGLCDGRRRLGEALDLLARAAGGDAGAFREQIADGIRRLHVRGFLVRAG